MSVEQRRALIEPGHRQLPIVRQCALVSISRSSFYHRPVGETAETLALMRTIDAQFLETPPLVFQRLRAGTFANSALVWVTAFAAGRA